MHAALEPFAADRSLIPARDRRIATRNAGSWTETGTAVGNPPCVVAPSWAPCSQRTSRRCCGSSSHQRRNLRCAGARPRTRRMCCKVNCCRRRHPQSRQALHHPRLHTRCHVWGAWPPRHRIARADRPHCARCSRRRQRPQARPPRPTSPVATSSIACARRALRRTLRDCRVASAISRRLCASFRSRRNQSLRRCMQFPTSSD